MSYRIGAYLIDPAAYEIRCDDRLVPVEPQVFELLVFLIESRHRAVTKDEIIERIWKGRIVSDATLSSRIKAARQALGDDGVAQKLIRTVHGRGFRFVAEVTEAAPAAAASAKPQKVGLAQHDEAQTPAASHEPAGWLSGTGLAAILPGSRRWTVAAGALAVLLGTGFLVNYLLTAQRVPAEIVASRAAIRRAPPLKRTSQPSRTVTSAPKWSSCPPASS